MSEWIPLTAARQHMPTASGIYLVRHIVSGKEYVGLSQNLRQRTSRHVFAAKRDSLLHRAIRKHGAEVFEICVYALAEFADLPRLEAQVIAERKTMTPAGYNLTSGGEGTVGRRHTDEAKEKMRQARLGTSASAETRAKMSRSQADVWTPEMRAKMSATITGKVRPDETRRRMGEANRRRPPEHWERVAAATRAREVSDETKRKMSENARNRSPEHLAKISASKLGKFLSAETKAKMSAARSRPVLVWVPESMVPLTFPSSKAAAEWFGRGQASISGYCAERARAPCGTVFAYYK